MNIKVTLEGFRQVWSPGQLLIDLEVTLGQNDNSNNCTILLSDPLGTIASALINHSIKSGGIKPLPTTTSNTQSSNTPTPSTPVAATNSVPAARGAEFSPQVLAFLDLLAHKEVPKPLEMQGYYTLSQNSYFSESEAARGFPVSAGRRNVGRYQFNRSDWEDFRKSHPDVHDYLPITQDRMVVWKMKSQNKGWRELMAGDIRGAILKAGKEWASLPGSPYGQVQPGYTMDKAIAYYQERLKVHQGGAQIQPQPVAKLQPSAENDNSSQPELIKGNRITIQWGDVEFQFYHQGTEWDETGITKVTGQGTRWVLNRRKRNKSIRNTSLKALATRIAAAHKLQLDWQATYDPTYEHIDQSGISDYQLLLREANHAGLWVSEEPGKLVIKSRDKIRDSGFVVARGDNLIKYQISDKALDPNNSENAVMLQEETKATVEPTTGRLVPQVPDVDSARAIDTTGKPTKEIAGKPKPGQDAILAQNRARMKRIKGLPSRFVVLLGLKSLLLKPMDAIRTTGFDKVLNRIWMIDKLTHKLSEGTTTIDVYSPVEVLDESPTTPVQPQQQPSEEPPVVPGSWVYPASGTVTSLFGPRSAPIRGASTYHRGADIAAASGTPILAAADGVAIYQPGFNGGAGNMVVIKHDNGYTTRYFHLASSSIRSGERVRKGQRIAAMGTTGRSTGTHLHFEVFPPGVPVSRGNQINPAKIFPKLGRRLNSVLGGTAP